MKSVSISHDLGTVFKHFWVGLRNLLSAIARDPVRVQGYNCVERKISPRSCAPQKFSPELLQDREKSPKEDFSKNQPQNVFASEASLFIKFR